MVDELELEGMSEEDFDDIPESGAFVEIPPNSPDGVPRAGDSIILDVEVTDCREYSARALIADLMVITKGNNYGKTASIYPGISKEGLGITKRMAKAFGIADTFFAKKDGKVSIVPTALIGAQAKARFSAEWSTPQEEGKKPVLRSVTGATEITAKEEAATGEEPPF